MSAETKRAPLTESRKSDRAEMADRLESLAAQHGWMAERENLAPTETYVMLRGPTGGLRVGIEFDGRSPQRDNHCMPWNSDARMSDAFGHAMGAPVNPYHRCKCTAFAFGFNALYAAVERAMVMAADGTAFE